MLTLLIATDGSEYSDHAVDYVIARARSCRDPVFAHLLNVQVQLHGVNVKIFIRKESIDEYHRDEGMAVLRPACARLEAAGVHCEAHIGVGDAGEVIVEYAASKACDEIVMGTQGRGALAGAVMGSVAQKVVYRAKMPVVLVK
ncbi:MAG: universal stress protein [Gammaproteobacteria bacterium]|nr:MAG: universal stress protein [Gammaproteobacteria bacterium]